MPSVVLAALLAALLTALLCVAAAAPLAAQEDAGAFRRQRVALTHELAAALPVDLDGDGRLDLVVVEAERGNSRDVPYTLRVLRQTEAAFVPLESATAPLPPHVSLVDVGRFSFGAGLALHLPGEVQVWPWRGGRFAAEAALRLPVEGVFPVANGELKQGVRWVEDVSGDGRSELLVPRFDGVDVVTEAPAVGLRRRVSLRHRANARLLDWSRRDMIAYDLPWLGALQVDGRGWKDIVLYQDGQVWVFLLDDAMGSGERAPAFLRDLQPPRPFDPAEPRDPPLRLVSAEDLNRDGHFDLVLSKNAATDSQFNTRSNVVIYFGGPGVGGAPISFAPEPDQVLFTEGFSLPLLLDIDGDGRRDLVLVNVAIGFWNVIKALISRSVSAEAAFYLMAPDGRYPREPQHLETYDVSFSLGRYSHQPIADFGDLNGDGLPDLLLSIEQDAIGIHWGRKGAVWDDDPDARLRDFMPINGRRVRVLDLDGDRRDDLVFAYDRDDIRLMPEVNRSFTVLRSRFGRDGAAPEASPAPERPGGPVRQQSVQR